MHKSFIDQVASLNHAQVPYATAHVVRRTVPSSAKPGDKAIVTVDGNLFGWIGGGCTKGIVLKEALLSLMDGKPRLVKISPRGGINGSSEVKTYTMTCQSGGEVEVYIEPVLPRPHIRIFGTSHIGMALAKIASAMEYRVTAVMQTVDQEIFPSAHEWIALEDYDPEGSTELSYVVVCTQGDGDAQALYKAILSNPKYLAFVASMRKANAIFRDLRQMGVTADQLRTIKTPAGLDIGAKLPEEVAISILAQIIEHFRNEKEFDPTENGKKESTLKIQNDAYYLNPVCNIPIQKSTAKHILEYHGEKVYFCCDGCKVQFEKSPDSYIPAI
jgi:xanthine dehydrogenase accessory factor